VKQIQARQREIKYMQGVSVYTREKYVHADNVAHSSTGEGAVTGNFIRE
jgi:hypothetical protein